LPKNIIHNHGLVLSRGNKEVSARATTYEEFLKHQSDVMRFNGPGGNGQGKWGESLRLMARRILNNRLAEHKAYQPELEGYQDYLFKGQRLEKLFHRVVNGPEHEARMLSLRIVFSHLISRALRIERN
jgi:hypothetical protein